MPPWVTPEVKSALVQNRSVYSAWVKKGRPPAEYPRVQLSQSTTNSLVTSAKKSYIDDLSRKLCDPTSGPKAFHTALSALLTKRKSPIYHLSLKMEYSFPNLMIKPTS